MVGGQRCGPRKVRQVSICVAPVPPSRRLRTATGGRGHLKRSLVSSGLTTIPEEFRTAILWSRELHRRNPGLRIGRTGRVFDALLVAIVAQKVTGQEAGRGMRQLTRKYSEPAPGPMPLRLPPDPERLAAATYFDLHPLGIEQRRADTIRRAASDATRIERLTNVSPVGSKYLSGADTRDRCVDLGRDRCRQSR